MQADKEVVQKKAAAKKLLQEKERAIEQGIREKMKVLEKEHAEQLLDAALNLDVGTEIERRLRAASKYIEESRGSEYD